MTNEAVHSRHKEKGTRMFVVMVILLHSMEANLCATHASLCSKSLFAGYGKLLKSEEELIGPQLRRRIQHDWNRTRQHCSAPIASVPPIILSAFRLTDFDMIVFTFPLSIGLIQRASSFTRLRLLCSLGFRVVVLDNSGAVAGGFALGLPLGGMVSLTI